MKTHVDFLGKRKFKIKARDFEVVADLPEQKGGDNTAPTPPELFMASLGSCIGVFAASYCDTAGMDSTGMSIDMDWEMAEDGSRVENIEVHLNVPNAELGARKKALLAVAKKCVIHNTLHNPPEITIEIVGD